MNILIVGKPGIGKTTVAEKIIEYFKKENIPYGGILCPGSNIVDVSTGETHTFLFTEEIPDAIRAGTRYHIPIQEIEFGKEKIINSANNDKYTFVDEYGKLELKKEGIYNALKKSVLKNKSIVLVKDINLEAFKEEFNKQDHQVYILNENNRDEIPSKIIKFIEDERR